MLERKKGRAEARPLVMPGYAERRLRLEPES
jgi:hypothetical protein